ncbi:hypothetical protein [Streptomyces sp. RFCAC02]|uniref:hypothetical protein n=1 Tax=Streptomyces sp. RFCAC02 TaxID=2499143 RepID=UPI00101FDE4A|nr:hypothetical protein [Streptomyces sp. RFCAC02]
MAGSVDVTFSKDEVEGAAQRKPWRTQRDFHAEIDPEEMADTAMAYARAAAGGAATEDLGERAARVAEESGEGDGAALVDGQGRIDDTVARLQKDSVDRVVGLLIGAMNRALDADEKTSQRIVGPHGLDEAYGRHLSAAINEWNGWQDALGEAVYRTRTWAYDTPPAITLTYNGTSRSVAPSAGADGAALYSIDDWAPEIRERHLRAAATDASTAADDIDEEITAYRTKLMDYAAELNGEGYDISEGPLDLWTGEAMATWAADRLAELLNTDSLAAQLDPGSPDAEEINRLMAGIQGILNGVYDTPYEDEFDAPGPSREMTAEELAYLKAFYGRLSGEDLATLGVLSGGGAPGAATQLEEAQRTAANGVLLLTDPEAGGLDPARQRDDIPESIAPFVYDYADILTPGVHADVVRDFDGFGQLMSRSDLAPGEQFGEDLANAAIGIDSRTQYVTEGYNADPMNTGTRNFLEVANRRDGLATELMADKDFTDRLLSTEFPKFRDTYSGEEPEGPALAVDIFTRDATWLPKGVAPGSDAAAPYADAAYNYLSYAEHAYTSDPDDVSRRQIDQGTIDRLLETYGKSDPDRFGRFEDLADGPTTPDPW